jgi:hypothetical protein
MKEGRVAEGSAQLERLDLDHDVLAVGGGLDGAEDDDRVADVFFKLLG